MLKKVEDLQIGDKIQTLRNGILEVVSKVYTPLPKNLSWNSVCYEGNYFTLGLKKENGCINVTYGHKPHDMKEVLEVN